MNVKEEGKLSLVGLNCISLYKDMVVELKQDVELVGENFKKGAVGLVVKGGKSQIIDFLNEKGERRSFRGNFLNMVIYTDKKFEEKNSVALEHGMKVEMKDSFKVGKHHFKIGAIGIVVKEGLSTQKIMIENSKGWYVEISGNFTQRVNVLNKKD